MKKRAASAPATLKLTPLQLGSLASSPRMAIIQRLDIDGHASARELAERLGRPVTALYHHLERLQQDGLVRVVEHRSTGRRPEAVYAVAAAQLSSVDAVRTAAGRRSLVSVATRAVAASLRAFAALASSAAARFDGPQRNCAVRHLSFRADAARLARLNALIDSLEQTSLQPGDEGEPMLLTVLLSAAPPRRAD